MSGDGWVHDLVASMQQAANEQTKDMELCLVGYCIEYDVLSHMGRFLLTSRGGYDEGDNFKGMETGWCQIGSPQVGDNFGDQYCLKGGATQENPEQGEEAQIVIQFRHSGLSVCANLTFNDKLKPPGNGQNSSSSGPSALEDSDGSYQLQPTERIIKFPMGSFLKWYANGDIQLFAANNLVMIATKDVDIKAGQNVNITAMQNINETATENVNVTATEDVNVTATENVEITATQDVDITATGDINVESHAP